MSKGCAAPLPLRPVNVAWLKGLFTIYFKLFVVLNCGSLEACTALTHEFFLLIATFETAKLFCFFNKCFLSDTLTFAF